MKYEDLNWFQIDVLKEVTNIGIGNAVSKLSEFFDDNIEMTVPTVEIIPFQQFFDAIGDPEDHVYAIFSQFSGEIEGSTFFLFKEKVVKHFLDVFNMPYSKETMATKIGSIVSSSFVNSLSELSHLNILQSPSYFCYDMLGAIVQQGLLEYSELSEQVIFIENSFTLNNHNLEGHFIFFPNPQHLSVLFSKLGVPADED